MKQRFFKVSKIISIFLVVCIVLAAIGTTWFVRRSWPQVSGTIKTSGVSAPVKVIRDRWGVPHIYAQNETDLFFVQGYVQAQDRLWQMEFGRRVGNGTLSAVLGEATVEIDRVMRTAGLGRVAEEDWLTLDDESRVILQAYADGVNAYIEDNRNRLPLEFTLLGVEPAPWKPTDTLAWGKVMNWQLAGDYTLDLLRDAAVSKYGLDASRQVLPFPDDLELVGNQTGNDNRAWIQDGQINPLAMYHQLLGRPNLYTGSNSWVVHGSRTVTGKPMLASDTHLGLGLPSIWYENGLHGGRFNSVGFTLPGVPLMLIGHNDRIAWAPTNLSIDLQDLYLEKVDDPANPKKYEFMGEWYDLEVIPQTIEVKDAEPIQFNVLMTRHGPLINDALYLKHDQPLAMHWPDLKGTALFRAVKDLNLATNWDEFRQALSYWGAPKQNFVYADIDGNIGYQTLGNIPIRAPHHHGVLPVPGWTGEYEWQGYIPYDDLPSIYNPPSGFIVACNSPVVPSYVSAQLPAYNGVATYRADRIAQLLTSKEKLSMEDMRLFQADTFAVHADSMLKHLLVLKPENDQQAQALDELRNWDRYFEIDRVGASIFQVWSFYLEQNMVGDELGEDLLFEYQIFGLINSPRFLTLLAQTESPWFDDLSTPQKETRDEIIMRSLADALEWLNTNYGEDMRQWQWGTLHTKSFDHQPLGSSGVGILERLFNTPPLPARGSDFTVNNGWFNVSEPFKMQGGTAQRFIADLSDINQTWGVLSTGQSGHLFHPHRSDMIEMWQNVQHHPMPFTEAQAQQYSESELMFEP